MPGDLWKLPPLPAPEKTYADHSYPAYSAAQIVAYATAATDEAAALLRSLSAEREELRRGLETLVADLDALINESEGVYGLHRNGDGAPWDEITAGGRFEGWLSSLEDARAAIASPNQETRSGEPSRGGEER